METWTCSCPTDRRPRSLYVNDGSGHFTEQAVAFNLDVDGNHRGALWFDADGDRDLDLVTVGDCFLVPCTGAPTVRLHQQLASGVFREVTLAAASIETWRPS